VNIDLQAFDRELTPLAREKSAMKAGFIQRKPRKIDPLELLKAFCMLLPQLKPVFGWFQDTVAMILPKAAINLKFSLVSVFRMPV
jgi:hypothetical protein